MTLSGACHRNFLREVVMDTSTRKRELSVMWPRLVCPYRTGRCVDWRAWNWQRMYTLKENRIEVAWRDVGCCGRYSQGAAKKRLLSPMSREQAEAGRRHAVAASGRSKVQKKRAHRARANIVIIDKAVELSVQVVIPAEAWITFKIPIPAHLISFTEVRENEPSRT